MTRWVAGALAVAALTAFLIGVASGLHDHTYVLSAWGGLVAFILAPALALSSIVLRVASLDPGHKRLVIVATAVLFVGLAAYFPPWTSGRLSWSAEPSEAADPLEPAWRAGWYLVIACVVATVAMVAYWQLHRRFANRVSVPLAGIFGLVGGFLILPVLPLSVPAVVLLALVLQLGRSQLLGPRSDLAT